MSSSRLQQLPLALFRAWEQQSAGLLREYTLTVLGGAKQPFDLGDVARVQSMRQHLSASVERAADALPTSNGAFREPVSLDVGVDVPSDDTAAFGLMQGILDHANRLAHAGDLLVLPALSEVAALRNWICDQIVSQAAGAPPKAWQLPGGMLDEPGQPLAAWRGITDLPVDEAWLVGDDANRIIAASQPALDLLGWKESELIGQRIVVVIPPALRELHVASFTRGLLTGNYHLLDQPLELSAHTRDGNDVDVRLTLQRHVATRGRTVFLARLERR